MKNDVVLFLIMISLMKITMISTELIFKNSKDNLKFSQVEKIKHDNEANLHRKYKRNLEFLSSPSTKSVYSPSIIQKDFKAKKIAQDESKTCNRKNCKIPYGQCIDDKICRCLDPYANLDSTGEISENNKINYSVIINRNQLDANNNDLINNFYNNRYNGNTNGSQFCQYKQKSQLIAFALEAIFMAGIGHLYLNRFLHGGVKFALYLVLGLIYFLAKRKNVEVKFFANEQTEELKISMLNLFLVLSVTGLLALQVYDLVMLGSNSFLDGFGIPLLSWNRGFGDMFLLDYKNSNYLDI